MKVAVTYENGEVFPHCFHILEEHPSLRFMK